MACDLSSLNLSDRVFVFLALVSLVGFIVREISREREK